MADLVNRARVHLCAAAYVFKDLGRIRQDEVDRVAETVERMDEDELFRVIDDLKKRAGVA